MAPSSPADQHLSALQQRLDASQSGQNDSAHSSHLQTLASQILHDLKFQHEWTGLTIHTHSPIGSDLLPRPIISGLPPRRSYIHPDEQTETLKAEHALGTKLEQLPEREWVLPTHLKEKMSLSKFAAVFDGICVVPPLENGSMEPVEDGDEEKRDPQVGAKWQGKNRQKRLLLATLHDDSTITYYIMHDGIVKPRQN